MAAVIRGTGVLGSAIAVVFFAGVALNSLAVRRWVADHGDGADVDKASVLDLVLFALATVIPGALVVALGER